MKGRLVDVAASGAEGEAEQNDEKTWKNGDCQIVTANFWTIKKGVWFFAHRLIMKEDLKVNANSLGFFAFVD